MSTKYIFALLIACTFSCQSKFISTYQTDQGAIKGYDPVAYFTNDQPIKGNRDIFLLKDDAKWFFANETNKKLFQENPEKYLPQYGGYCAYAVANGNTADIDPNAWEIYNGKLYLMYSVEYLEIWKKDIDNMIDKSHANSILMNASNNQ